MSDTKTPLIFTANGYGYEGEDQVFVEFDDDIVTYRRTDLSSEVDIEEGRRLEREKIMEGAVEVTVKGGFGPVYGGWNEIRRKYDNLPILSDGQCDYVLLPAEAIGGTE